MWRVDSLEKTDAGRDWGQEEKGTTENEMAGWHHRLNGHESEWTPGVGDGQGSLAEKAMAPHSSTLAWKIPWMEEPGRLQSMRSLRVGHDWATSLSLFSFMHWRRKWQPTPVFLPGELQGRGSLVVCHLWGHTESDMTERLSSNSSSNREAWSAAIHGVAKSRTRLSDWIELNFKMFHAHSASITAPTLQQATTDPRLLSYP